MMIRKHIGESTECDTVCHCNVRENAELVAQILDYDNLNKVAPFVPFFPEECED